MSAVIGDDGSWPARVPAAGSSPAERSAEIRKFFSDEGQILIRHGDTEWSMTAAEWIAAAEAPEGACDHGKGWCVICTAEQGTLPPPVLPADLLAAVQRLCDAAEDSEHHWYAKGSANEAARELATSTATVRRLLAEGSGTDE